MTQALSITRVAQFRETVSKVVAMLTERGLEVTQEGISAFVRYDPQTGLPNRVNIPVINDNADDVFLSAVRGFIDHECAHVLFSDGRVLLDAVAANARIKAPLNILEDVMIERRMCERFPGAAKHIADTWRFLLEKQVLPGLELAQNEQQTYGMLLPSLVHAWAGKREAQEFLDNHNLWPRITGLTDRLAPMRAKIAADWADSAATVPLAREMLDLLRNAAPPAPNTGEASEKAPADQPAEQKGEDKDKSEGMPSEASPFGDDDQKSGEGQGDQSDKPPNDKGDDDKGEGGKPGEETGEDDTPGEDGEPSKGDQGESGQKGGTASGESDAEPTGADEETAEQTGATPAPGESEIESSKDLSEALDQVADFESMLSDTLRALIASGTESGDYTVFSRDYDRFDKPIPAAGNQHKAERLAGVIEAETAAMTGQLANQFRRLFAAQEQVLNVGGMRSGRLQASALHRLALNDDRVFYRREEHTSTDTAVSLVIDCSGSMNDAGKIDLALTSAYAFSNTLERVGISHEVIGFTTRSDNWATTDLWERIYKDQEAMGRGYSRQDAIQMLEFKTFDERLRLARTRFAAMRTEFGWDRPFQTASNIDGESILYAAERLIRRRERRKVMVVFSDGMPAGAANGKHLNKHLKAVVKELGRVGIETLGIGIKTDSVKEFYPKNVVLNRAEDLPQTVMREISAILLARR
jgi:Mg-chelatase subunit ChlD